MAFDRKVANSIQGLFDRLTMRLRSATYPTPVVQAVDVNGDLYLQVNISGNGTPDAIIRIKPEATPANETPNPITGVAVATVAPHVAEVGLNTAVGTPVRVPVLCELATTGYRLVVYEKAGIVLADVGVVANQTATFNSIEFGYTDRQ